MREDRNGYGSRKEGFQTAKLRRSCPQVARDVGLTPTEKRRLVTASYGAEQR